MCSVLWVSQAAPVVKRPSANAGDVRDVGLIPGLGRFPGGGHGYSILAWRILWTEESGILQSTASQRVGHDSARMQGCFVLNRHWWHSWKEFTFFPVFFFKLNLFWLHWLFIAARGSSCPVACGILVPWWGNWTYVLCIGRWIVNHWAIREVLP